MAFSWHFGPYNVEGSLNEWVRINLTAYGLPAWMPSARVVFDYAELPLVSGYSGHAFALTHLGAPEVAERFQGRHTLAGSAGQLMSNLLRIDCWQSRDVARGSYNLRLRQMGDMVERLFSSGREVQITNLYTAGASPSAIGGLIRLFPAEGVSVSPVDPANPDMARRGYLVRYQWMERT